ncbi:MAG: hypothetical protein IJS40_04645 [Synergistaceae bacterium]|nr:hypothetical protein [Synergistaceae bacterium]
MKNGNEKLKIIFVRATMAQKFQNHRVETQSCKIIFIMKNNLIIKNFYDELSNAIGEMKFSAPVAVVYNPLQYAADGLEKYLRYSEGSKRVVFLGMNPGPWGMAQTGVPFGEIKAVKNFLGLNDIKISSPANEHPLYPVQGLSCTRTEVSGKRLWGLFKERFGTAEKFFEEHFVLNYCPLLFLTESGENRVRNLTPDKLEKSERKILYAACDLCLKKIIEVLKPKFVVAIGNFAEDRALEALDDLDVTISKILHPSPASPQSNQNWAGTVTSQLIEARIWN